MNKHDEITNRFKLQPERSDWRCLLFGGGFNDGIVYIPKKGNEPNFFVRWMMKVCFDCRWVKVKPNEGVDDE